MFLFELVELFARIGPRGQRIAQTRLDVGLRRDRARFVTHARRFVGETSGEPREHTGQIGAALALARFAIVVVTLEEDALPELVDQPSETERNGGGVRTRLAGMRFDQLAAKARDGLVVRGVAVAADALIVVTRIRLGQKCIPDRNLARVAE